MVVEWPENQQVSGYNKINDRRVETDTLLRQDPRGTAGWRAQIENGLYGLLLPRLSENVYHGKQLFRTI